MRSSPIRFVLLAGMLASLIAPSTVALAAEPRETRIPNEAMANVAQLRERTLQDKTAW